MADKLIPKIYTYLVVLACLVLNAGVILFFWSAFRLKLREPLFTVPWIILTGLWIFYAGRWLVTLKEDVWEYFSARMWPTIILAALALLWVGGWASQFKADKSDHIEYVKPK